MSRWSVVVPSNRPERLDTFKDAWLPIFEAHGANLIVVRDEPPWEGVPAFIPRRSDMIRSWGFYLAWKSGSEFTVSLDDDVLPLPDHDLLAEYEAGFAEEFPLAPYLSVGSLTDAGLEMRGFPYAGRSAPVGFQYGGWDGVLDFDAVTQIAYLPPPSRFLSVRVSVPLGCATTCCAMNFAFRAELTPLAWQLALLEGRYNRMGDIWGGLFQKRALDALGLVMLVNGQARVRHERASDPWQNLAREAPGMGLNEGLWSVLAETRVPPTRVTDAYREVTDAAVSFFESSDRAYARAFSSCRDAWLELFG